VMKVASDHHERLEVPDEALDMHTRRGRQMGRGWEHFTAEGNRFVELDDTDTEMAVLEAEAREHFARCCGKDPTLPANPWQFEKPAQNSQHGDIGQLRLDGPERDR